MRDKPAGQTPARHLALFVRCGVPAGSHCAQRRSCPIGSHTAARARRAVRFGIARSERGACIA